MKESTAGYQDTIKKVAYERFTGKPADTGFTGNYWTNRGHELEYLAVECYEIDTFSTVTDGGFWTCGDWWGASPDGLIEPDGLFEGKAPKFTTHMGYLAKGVLPSTYKWQPHFQMLCTDRNWVDFQSFDLELPPFRIRVHRDEKKEAELIKALQLAQEQAESIIKDMEKYSA